MIIIGEKLNSSIPKTLEAIKSHDTPYLIGLIRSQTECGADYLDLNTAVAGREAEDMAWLIRLVKEHSDCGIMIDSQRPETILSALPLCADRRVIVNSVTPDAAFAPIFPVLAASGAGVVCMPAGGIGLSQTPAQRAETAVQLCSKLTAAGFCAENLYVDIMAEALATADRAGAEALKTLREVHRQLPSVHTVCGLSNISFGLPRRGLLNRSFLAAAMANGLDSAILDITSPAIQETLAACAALLGQDEFCMEYIGFIRTSEE